MLKGRSVADSGVGRKKQKKNKETRTKGRRQSKAVVAWAARTAPTGSKFARDARAPRRRSTRASLPLQGGVGVPSPPRRAWFALFHRPRPVEAPEPRQVEHPGLRTRRGWWQSQLAGCTMASPRPPAAFGCPCAVFFVRCAASPVFTVPSGSRHRRSWVRRRHSW